MNRQLRSQLLRPPKTEVDAKRRRLVGSGKRGCGQPRRTSMPPSSLPQYEST